MVEAGASAEFSPQDDDGKEAEGPQPYGRRQRYHHQRERPRIGLPVVDVYDVHEARHTEAVPPVPDEVRAELKLAVLKGDATERDGLADLSGKVKRDRHRARIESGRDHECR